MVVEFDPELALVPFRIAVAFGADRAADLTLGRGGLLLAARVDGTEIDLSIGDVIPEGVGTFQHRAEALAFDAFVGLEVAEVGDGRVEVDEFGDALGGPSVGGIARVTNDERYAGRVFVEGALLPEAVLAEVIPVVADEHHDGVLLEALLLQLGQHQAELGVHEAHRGKVGLLGGALGVLGHPIVGDGGVGESHGGFRLTVAVGFLGQLHLILRVLGEVRLRRDVGRVRTEEADREEERLIALLAEEVDRLRGDLAVGLFGIGAVGGEPAQGATVITRAHEDLAHLARVLRCGRAGRDADREDLVFVIAVAAAGIPDSFPRLRVVEAVGADLLRHAVVVELTDAGDGVAVVLEQLRHGHHVGDDLAELFRVIVDAGGVRAQAREEGGPARVAEGVLAVGAVEADAGAGEGVDVRRQRRTAVGAHAGSAIVGDKQKDVLPRCREKRQTRKEESGGWGEAHGPI